MVRFLTLLEGRLHTPNQANVLVDDNTQSEDILLGLAVVKLFYAELYVGEAVERGGERRGKLNESERVQGGRKVAAAVGESFALGDDCVGGFEEGFELVLECVEVYFAVVEPLGVMLDGDIGGDDYNDKTYIVMLDKL